MGILIVYASGSGDTRACVERLCNGLARLDVTVADLSKETPDPSAYDFVVFGSSVRFARLLKPARNYLKQYAAAVEQLPHALFLVCGLAHEYEYYRDVLFPKSLSQTAQGVYYFGGTLRYDGHPWYEKLLIRSVREQITKSEIDDGEYTPSLPGLLPETVDLCAALLREEYLKAKRN